MDGQGSSGGRGVGSGDSSRIVPSDTLSLGTVGDLHADADADRPRRSPVGIGALDLEPTDRPVGPRSLMYDRDATRRANVIQQRSDSSRP
jgi:hypothetical protein